MIKPQPDEEQIFLIRKILKNYSDKISAIKIDSPFEPHLSKIMGTVPIRGQSPSSIDSEEQSTPKTGQRDSTDVLSEKLAYFEQKINEMNTKINQEKEIFHGIREKIEIDIANLPSKHVIQPDTRAPLLAPLAPWRGIYPAISGSATRPVGIPTERRGGEALTPTLPQDKTKPMETVDDKSTHFVQPDIPPVTGPGIDRSTQSRLPIAIHLLSGSGPAPANEKIAVHHSRFWTVVGLIGILMSAGGLGIWWYINSIKSVHKVFPLSYNQTAGLAVKNMSIFSIDPQRHLLFTMIRDDGRVKTVQKFPNQHLSGLAAGDDSLWSTDMSRIYQHNMDSGWTIRRTFSNPSQNPGAIYWDGSFLWIGDYRSATVCKYTIKEDSLVLVKQYALEGIIPVGLYMSENLLWIFDATASKIVRYRVETTLNLVDSMNMGSLIPAGSKVTGFTVDGSDLWLVTENPAELHRFDVKRLTRAFQSVSGGK